MTAKEYLARGWRIEARIEALEARLTLLRARAGRVKSSAPKRVPGGGRARGWTEDIELLCDAEAEMARELTSLCRVEAEVRAAVDGVADVRQRAVLELRYLRYLSWPAIADRLGYDVRSIHYLHGRALKAVEQSTAL